MRSGDRTVADLMLELQVGFQKENTG
jgi:hypothetical protein